MSYSETTIKPIRRCKLRVINLKNQKKCKLDFVVTDDIGTTPILGNTAVQQMGLIEVTMRTSHT